MSRAVRFGVAVLLGVLIVSGVGLGLATAAANRTPGTLFGVLALLTGVASLVTLFAARASWRGWGKDPGTLGFHPLLPDVRELIERISQEREADSQGGAWTAERLKNVLKRRLQGEQVVIVANREPYSHERADDGNVQVVRPASGLVTALEPVMRACSGAWIAHGSGSADRSTADANGRLKVPPGEESYTLQRVWLSQEEVQGYYYGFSNEGLWPLCHIAHTRPAFRTEDWKYYQAVNQKFADAAVSAASTDDPIVLVQDYHFALVPRMVRAQLPRATVLSFWHIPWPNAEVFGICPWRDELLDGMLGSSIFGFHTQLHCNNFLDAVDRFMEARIDRETNVVIQGGHSTLVRAYPISLEWPVSAWQDVPPADACRASVIKELGLSEPMLLGVGVDRLDYTKGIEERLLAVERLLERFPELRGKFTFIQLGSPSRTAIPRYQQLQASVQAVADRINRRFGTDAYRPVIFLLAHHEPSVVFRYYRAADVCYVSSLHDGMNLVAKEYVAARDDEKGVLVLSHFTGASRELTQALIVNPYDLDEASGALAMALSMPADEQRQRMRAMRAFVSEFNVYRWAGRMLADATRLRQQERFSASVFQRARSLPSPPS